MSDEQDKDDLREGPAGANLDDPMTDKKDQHRQQPLQDGEIKGREAMPMQLRTQLKRNLL